MSLERTYTSVKLPYKICYYRSIILNFISLCSSILPSTPNPKAIANLRSVLFVTILYKWNHLLYRFHSACFWKSSLLCPGVYVPFWSIYPAVDFWIVCSVGLQ